MCLCKFELLQKDESGAKQVDSSQACCQAFFIMMLNWKVISWYIFAISNAKENSQATLLGVYHTLNQEAPYEPLVPECTVE